MRELKAHYQRHKRRYYIGLSIVIGVIALGITSLYIWNSVHETVAATAAPDLETPIALPEVENQAPPTDRLAPGVPGPSAASVPTDTSPDIPPLAPNPKTAPVIAKIETKKRVVFMGLDDGIVKDPRAIEYIKQHHYPFTLFLADNLAGDNYAYFKPLVSDASNTVEDHTLHHPMLTRMSFDQQKGEICGQAAIIEREFGARPKLLRPPFGLYNATTQLAAAACGMKAVVLWSAKVNDGKIQYQLGNHIRPGDIMLMHFRKKVIEDLQAFTNEIESQHLTVAKLEDWLR